MTEIKRPEAVVVDYRDSYTWAKDADGQPFTAATAARYAARLNAECRPANQTYAVLPVGEEAPCAGCGGGYHQPDGEVERFTEQYIPHAGKCEVVA